MVGLSFCPGSCSPSLAPEHPISLQGEGRRRAVRTGGRFRDKAYAHDVSVLPKEDFTPDRDVGSGRYAWRSFCAFFTRSQHRPAKTPWDAYGRFRRIPNVTVSATNAITATNGSTTRFFVRR